MIHFQILQADFKNVSHYCTAKTYSTLGQRILFESNCYKDSEAGFGSSLARSARPCATQTCARRLPSTGVGRNRSSGTASLRTRRSRASPARPSGCTPIVEHNFAQVARACWASSKSQQQPTGQGNCLKRGCTRK